MPMPDSATPEPRFVTFATDDAAMQAAHALASASMNCFRTDVDRSGSHLCCAKLSFRDPNAADEQRIYIWLTDVRLDPEQQLFVGTFFEVPTELHDWHHVGQELLFDPRDVFDWLVIDQGVAYGGYTLRVARTRLPAAQRQSFDKQAIGAASWAPLPHNT